MTTINKRRQQNRRQHYRPPFRIQFYYVGSTLPVTTILRSKRYADYLVNRALDSELCTHVIYKDSIKQNVKFFRHATQKKALPPDVVKFLKEQLNEQIQIRERNNRIIEEPCISLCEEEEMQSVGM
jgi:hypothetical protein